MDDALKVAKWRCEALKQRIHSLTANNTCKSTLLRLLQSELAFLNRLPPETSSASLSLNIGHLESVVHILQHPSVTAVSRVCKTLTLPSSALYVDIVCCVRGSPAWFIVSDRNPKYISWDSGTAKGLRNRVLQALDAARSSPALAPSSLILFFSNGLDHVVRSNLRDEFGAADDGALSLTFDCAFYEEEEEEEEDWINVLPTSYQSACVLKIEINTPTTQASVEECKAGLVAGGSFPEVEDQNVHLGPAIGESLSSLVAGLQCLPDAQLSDVELINFDTTALIAIVSGISNGGIDCLLSAPETKLRSRFKSNYEFVIAQVDSEILNPIHIQLMCVASGKRGIICQSVCSEFQELVSMCGGPKEKLRATYLLKHLRVVPDDPSSRVMNLPSTRKLALKNKVVFGTGDHWHAPTLTANMAFVRAVTQTGMSLFVLEHRPRALIGE